MATVREGNKGVLLVVDVQVGVMAEAWDSERIAKNVARAVERARAAGVPVVWVQHSDEELPYGSPQWQWVPELVPAEGETLIHKKFNSSFEQTELENELATLGATHIALAGAATNWCIRATAYGALAWNHRADRPVTSGLSAKKVPRSGKMGVTKHPSPSTRKAPFRCHPRTVRRVCP